MSSYIANNKLIYTWTRGAKAVPLSLLTSYAESLILDGDKRVIWHHGRQYGNSYYMSEWGENFNDFLHNTASGAYSHAEGTYTVASGLASHAAGINTYAAGDGAHSEGSYTHASSYASHAEGIGTGSYVEGGHAEGFWTNIIRGGESGHAEGAYTIVTGKYGHAEGDFTEANGQSSHAEGSYSHANGDGSHAEGLSNISTGSYGHSEGEYNEAFGKSSHAEGSGVKSYGHASHAEGQASYAGGDYSHSEGSFSMSYGEASHAEGHFGISYGAYSHTEGSYTVASGVAAHAEGAYSVAVGDYAHAEGAYSYAIGAYSHTMGLGTQAYNSSEVAVGLWNESIPGYKNERTIFTIGDGTSYENRHNVVAVTYAYSYIANKSYFGDYMWGPLTYSYVDYTGPEKTMDRLVQALLDEGYYTRPVMYTKLAYALNGLEPIDITDIVASYTEDFEVRIPMEVGTAFRPCVYIYWPTVNENRELGTRMAVAEPDYDTIATNQLGYAYTGNGNHTIQLYFNECSPDNWDYPKKTIDREADGAMAYINRYYAASGWTYLADVSLDEEPYGVMNEISVAYSKSSYMVYEQLARKGMRQISYGEPVESPWFDESFTTIPQSWYVDSRYRYWMGFSERLPHSRQELIALGHPTSTGFLEYNAENISSYLIHDVSHADSLEDGYFWVAVPEDYDIVSYNDRHFIEVTRNDKVNWDLISPLQKLRSGTISYMPIGEEANYGMPTKYKKNYNLFYVKFNFGAIGDDMADVVKVRVIGSEPGVGGSYLLFESGDKVAYQEPGDIATYSILFDDDAHTDYFGILVMHEGEYQTLMADTTDAHPYELWTDVATIWPQN